MKKALLAVSTLLALCIGGLVVVVVAGREQEQLAVDNLLAERLSLEVARSEVVRFDELTTFPWDTLLVVERDASAQEIEEHLAEDWRGGVNFKTGDLVVFVRDGRVARYADYRGEGGFEGVERPVATFARDDAVFRVEDLVITPAR